MKAPSEEITANQRNEHNGYIYNAVVVECIYSFSSCWLPNLRNPANFSKNSNLWQFRVIQGRRCWCQSKAHLQLPISH